MSAAALAEMAAELGLGEALLLGKGEDAPAAGEKPSILADAMEAVIGAVYLDGGIDAAPARSGARGSSTDAARRPPATTTTRAALQELAARPGSSSGSPSSSREDGPDHDKHFFAAVLIDGTAYGEGTGRSKKQAEQAAAQVAWQRLTTPPHTMPSRSLGWPRSESTMAELPEVETLRRDLEREIAGKRIKTVEVPGNGVDPPSRHEEAVHRPARGHQDHRRRPRRDLLLLIKLDSGDVLVVDLEHGGQLRRNAAKDALAKGTRVVITFTQGGQLRFIDDLGGLELFVVPADELDDRGARAAGARDRPARRADVVDDVRRDVLRRRAKLRTFLLDRTLVAGIGPVYADEILHAAGLRYDRSLDR